VILIEHGDLTAGTQWIWHQTVQWPWLML